MKRVLLFVLLSTLVWSCGDDDDNRLGAEAVPPRVLSEVAVENDEEIREFLETHFYNYEEFQAPPADFDFRIRIDTLAGDNATKIPLIDQISSKEVTVLSNEFLGLEEEEVTHTLYYLIAREGSGEDITQADSAYVRYEGRTLDLNFFDGPNELPVWFDLAILQSPQNSGGGGKNFRGFAEGASEIKPGGNVISNPDGTFEVEDYGVGMIIFPSGLGNFGLLNPSIPQYSPLIFTIDNYATNITDHDDDGVPSAQEDVNGNGYLFDDNTDEEDERSIGFGLSANFTDSDDDNDGVLTRIEISDEDGNIIFPYPDTDGDGTPDYLDPNIF